MAAAGSLVASILGFNSAILSLVKTKASFYFNNAKTASNYGLASPTNSAKSPAMDGFIFMAMAFFMIEFLVIMKVPPPLVTIFLTY